MPPHRRVSSPLKCQNISRDPVRHFEKLRLNVFEIIIAQTDFKDSMPNFPAIIAPAVGPVLLSLEPMYIIHPKNYAHSWCFAIFGCDLMSTDYTRIHRIFRASLAHSRRTNMIPHKHTQNRSSAGNDLKYSVKYRGVRLPWAYCPSLCYWQTSQQTTVCTLLIMVLMDMLIFLRIWLRKGFRSWISFNEFHLLVIKMWAGSAFIKADQRNPWIKDQLGNALLSTISHLQLPNFVSCGRDKPSHMTQNLVTVGAKL